MGEILNEIKKLIQETKRAMFKVEGTLDKNVQTGYADMDTMKKDGTGIIPQCAGGYGLLYLYRSFRQEVNFNTEEENKLQQTTINIYKLLNNYISENGYDASPYVANEVTQRWVGKDSGKYMGSLTWFWSYCLLIRYIHRKGWINFNEIIPSVNQSIIECIQAICKSQICINNKTGAWGFCDTSDRISLYFSYTVSASISDFYDYVYEEFKLGSSDQDLDKEFIQLLKNTKSPIEDCANLLDALEQVRSKLKIWVLKYVLPILPKLAEGRIPSKLPDESGVLPVKKSNEALSMGLHENDDYSYLYYALYAFDLIISSCANLRFKEIKENKLPELVELREFYEQQALLPYVDIQHGFTNRLDGRKRKDLCESLMEQAIHSIRATFSKVIRTGQKYWENPISSFYIYWKNKDKYENEELDIALFDNSNGYSLLRDPVILPLYLRVNSQYSYWISKEDDRIVTNAYEEIINDRINNEKRSSEPYFQLWDSISFNIIITEKAIESIVDYYNYVNKFQLDIDNSDVKEHKAPTTDNEVKQNFDLSEVLKTTIRNMINDYITSEEGKTIVNSIITQPVKDDKPNNAKKKNDPSFIDQFSELLAKMNEHLENYDALTSKDEIYEPARNMVELYENLVKGYIYKIILDKSFKNDNNFSTESRKRASTFIVQQKALITTIGEDLESNSGILTANYYKLKDLNKKKGE